MEVFEIGFYIFRKDLRTIDNRGLIKLSEKVDFIVPIFIFDEYQIAKTEKNKTYLSYPAVRFLCESVCDAGKFTVSTFHRCRTKSLAKLHLAGQCT